MSVLPTELKGEQHWHVRHIYTGQGMSVLPTELKREQHASLVRLIMCQLLTGVHVAVPPITYLAARAKL